MTTIALNKVNHFSTWLDAPYGKLLQIREGTKLESIIGVRCFLIGNYEEKVPCFLVLSHQTYKIKLGKIISSEKLKNCSAIDISKTAEIHVGDAFANIDDDGSIAVDISRNEKHYIMWASNASGTRFIVTIFSHETDGAPAVGHIRSIKSIDPSNYQLLGGCQILPIKQ